MYTLHVGNETVNVLMVKKKQKKTCLIISLVQYRGLCAFNRCRVSMCASISVARFTIILPHV